MEPRVVCHWCDSVILRREASVIHNRFEKSVTLTIFRAANHSVFAGITLFFPPNYGITFFLHKIRFFNNFFNNFFFFLHTTRQTTALKW